MPPPALRATSPRVGRASHEQHPHLLQGLRKAGRELGDTGRAVPRLPRAPLGRRPARRARAAVAEAGAVPKPQCQCRADRTADRPRRRPHGASHQGAGVERPTGDRLPAQGTRGRPRAALHDQGRLTVQPIANLYVHLPFCKHKCGYCDFNAYSGMDRLMPDYVEALERELAAAVERYRFEPLETIYLGGGTPSLLPPELMTRLLAFIRNSFEVAPDSEVTLEANPAST